MPRFSYGPPQLHGPTFDGDDDALIRRIQLESRWYAVELIYRISRAAWRRAEQMLDHRTVLGELLRGEPTPPEDALQDVHDVLAAAFRRDREGGRQLELPFDGLTPEQRLRKDWIDHLHDRWSSLTTEYPDLSRLILLAAIHLDSSTGESAEAQAVALLQDTLGFSSDFPDRVTECR